MFSFSGDGQDYDYEIGGSFGDTSGPEVQILPTTFTVTQTVFATGDTIFLATLQLKSRQSQISFDLTSNL